MFPNRISNSSLVKPPPPLAGCKEQKKKRRNRFTIFKAHHQHMRSLLVDDDTGRLTTDFRTWRLVPPTHLRENSWIHKGPCQRLWSQRSYSRRSHRWDCRIRWRCRTSAVQTLIMGKTTGIRKLLWPMIYLKIKVGGQLLRAVHDAFHQSNGLISWCLCLSRRDGLLQKDRTTIT